MMLVHASPYRPETFTYVHNHEDAKASFACQSAFVAFHGHTHRPAIWEMDKRKLRHTTPGNDPINLYKGSRYLVNVGSVGQPRDDDPRACYLIYDQDRQVVWYRRVSYDIVAAQRRFQEAGLVNRNADRLERGE
jgi:diadenosine tetraphosphatase ApaH/serine/threonine PP2A family protein phosphatase